MTEHVHYKNFYERAKEHFDESLPVAYRAQNMVKKQTKLIQFGDPAFPELNMKTPEELFETITEERFVQMVNAFKFCESQIMNLQENANEFQFKWHNLNTIQKCLKFHNHHRPDATGTGN